MELRLAASEFARTLFVVRQPRRLVTMARRGGAQKEELAAGQEIKAFAKSLLAVRGESCARTPEARKRAPCGCGPPGQRAGAAAARVPVCAQVAPAAADGLPAVLSRVQDITEAGRQRGGESELVGPPPCARLAWPVCDVAVCSVPRVRPTPPRADKRAPAQAS